MKGGWGLGWRQRFFSSLPSSDHVLSQEGEYLLLFATVPAQTIIKFIAQTNQCAQSVNPCKSIHMCAISESTHTEPRVSVLSNQPDYQCASSDVLYPRETDHPTLCVCTVIGYKFIHRSSAHLSAIIVGVVQVGLWAVLRSGCLEGTVLVQTLFSRSQEFLPMLFWRVHNAQLDHTVATPDQAI